MCVKSITSAFLSYSCPWRRSHSRLSACTMVTFSVFRKSANACRSLAVMLDLGRGCLAVLRMLDIAAQRSLRSCLVFLFLQGLFDRSYDFDLWNLFQTDSENEPFLQKSLLVGGEGMCLYVHHPVPLFLLLLTCSQSVLLLQTFGQLFPLLLSRHG